THAGQAVDLLGWPASPESMGRAIRRVATQLEKERSIRVELPGPTDKTRVLNLKKLPEPPIPPTGVVSTEAANTNGSGGSHKDRNGTAQAAQGVEDGGAVRADGRDGGSAPPAPQAVENESLTDSPGGLGGSGGFPANEPEIEEGYL